MSESQWKHFNNGRTPAAFWPGCAQRPCRLGTGTLSGDQLPTLTSGTCWLVETAFVAFFTAWREGGTLHLGGYPKGMIPKSSGTLSIHVQCVLFANWNKSKNTQMKTLYCKLHLSGHYAEANWKAVTLETHCRLWHPNVYYIVHSRSPLVPVLNTRHTIPSEFFKINFNIILPFMPWSSNCILLQVLQPRFATIYHPFCACYRTCPSPPLFDNYKIWGRLQIIKITLFTPVTWYVGLLFDYSISLRSILKRLQSTFFAYVQNTTKQNNIFLYFNLYVSSDRATSQAVIRWPLIAGFQVQYLTSQGSYVVDKVALDRSFFRVVPFSPLRIIRLMLHTHSLTNSQSWITYGIDSILL